MGIIEAAANKGMRLMDNELLRLVEEGKVDCQEALNRGHDKKELGSRLDLSRNRGRF